MPLIGFVLRVLIIVLMSASFRLALADSQPAVPAQPVYLLYLVDRSQSIENLQDTTQALLTHHVTLAELSEERVKLAVIFFGGQNEVTVLGDDKGMPTSAYQSLHEQLLKQWPKPAGSTPLDSAMEAAVRIVTALPPRSLINVVLFTDGEPSSGVLRPEAFADVQTAIDRKLKAIREKHASFSPAAIQNQLAKYENAVQTPETAEFNEIYQLQLSAEFQGTLAAAESMKKAGVRFVSVDYAGGLQKLRTIHMAAGGKPADLLLASPPSKALSQLNALGLTHLPGVLVQPAVEIPADPSRFEREYTVPLEPVGQRWLVTAVFDQGIPDFERQAVLETEIDGVVTPLDLANADSQRLLSCDSAGKLIAAHVTLTARPSDGQLKIRFRSKQVSITAPGCTVYIHLKLAADLLADLRPAHAAQDAVSPFLVSPTHDLIWRIALRSRDHGTAWPLRMAEPVLRNPVSGMEERLTAQADPQAHNTFATQPSRLPPGTYDAELHLILESGTKLVMTLSRHVVCQDKGERVTIDLSQRAGDQTARSSHHRGHPDFGEVGDTATSAVIESVFRSDGFDYPVTVELDIDHLFDSQETATKTAWIRATPNRFVLQPGQTQRVLLQLKVPDRIEEDLSDGAFHGLLHVVRTDLGTVLPAARYKPIAGVADDEPVDLVTFVLRRPALSVLAPRCFRNAVRQQGSQLTLPLQVSIHQPFQRSVIVRATHSSLLSRSVTAKMSAIFVDGRSKQVPSVRLDSRNAEPLTRDVAPGKTGEWAFLFDVDDDDQLQRTFGELTVVSPGLAPVHVSLEIVPRRPLLARTIRSILWGLAAVFAGVACFWLVNYLATRRFRAGHLLCIVPGKPLAGILSLKVSPRGQASLLTEQPVLYGFQRETKRAPLIENRPLPIPLDGLRSSNPLVIEEQTDKGVDGWKIAIQQYFPDPPEVHAEILEAPREAQRITHCWRRLLRSVAMSGACLGLAQSLFFPPVLAGAQWLFDLVTLA